MMSTVLRAVSGFCSPSEVFSTVAELTTCGHNTTGQQQHHRDTHIKG